MNPTLPTYVLSPTGVSLTIQCMGCGWDACSGSCLASHRARFGCHNPRCRFHPACPLPPADPASSSSPPASGAAGPTPAAPNDTSPSATSTVEAAEAALAEAYRALAVAHERLAAAKQRARGVASPVPPVPPAQGQAPPSPSQASTTQGRQGRAGGPDAGDRQPVLGGDTSVR